MDVLRPGFGGIHVEQAAIVTEYYKANPDTPRNIQRAESLAETLHRIEIRIDPLELIVGNRTSGVRAGVVSPEAGISWLDDEIERLPTRPQDKFEVRPKDITTFRRDILPFWKGKSLEDKVKEALGEEIEAIGKVLRPTKTLLVVDAISGAGVMPCRTDLWGIDLLVVGSQKALMGPPGLAFVAVSPRAWKQIESIRRPAFYFDLLAYRRALAKPDTPYTPAIPLVGALAETLRQIRTEGIERI
ncbi:MAG: aminotransferase class V-fold PLP-dependent enzyme, partial [Candidatus Aminicenantales bacterium]